MKKIVNFLFLAVIVSIATITTSSAGSITLDIEWEGENSTATGFITFGDSLLEISNPQGGFYLPSSAIFDFGINVLDDTYGNGTFGLSDFNGITFNSPSSLNFGTELIGQSLSNGCAFGVLTGNCFNSIGEFNLSTANRDGNTPTGIFYFTLAAHGTNNAYGDALTVKSIKPASVVPLPSSLVLFGLGLAGMCFNRTKKLVLRQNIGF